MIAMTHFMRTLLIALLLLLPAIAHGTMTIRNYSAARHYRFYTGSDKNFIGTLYDFSGVGYCSANNGTWATLVSSNYFISAAHYHPAIGSTVTFYTTNDRNATSYTYTVAGGQKIGSSDVWVGWFNTEVDSSIERYPILTLPSESNYIGKILYNYGKQDIVGRNVIESMRTASCNPSTGLIAEYDFDNLDATSVGGDETVLQYYDSGAPSFIVYDSSLTLVGIHWLSDRSTYSADTFVPEYVDEINAVLAAKSQSLMAVPEPDMIWYLMVIAGALMLQKRRHALAQ